jgi:hypothetical protein
MKIQLKAIKFYESMSEETNCFQGKLYINNKYVADVKNTGQGGNTDVYPIDKLSGMVIQNTNEWLASQPKKKSIEFDFEYHRNIESEVDDLFADWLQVKMDKKFQKEMDKGIMYGNKYHYKMTYWKNISITAMLNNPTGKARLIQVVKDLKAKGETILNTNLPDEVMGN